MATLEELEERLRSTEATLLALLWINLGPVLAVVASFFVSALIVRRRQRR